MVKRSWRLALAVAVLVSAAAAGVTLLRGTQQTADALGGGSQPDVQSQAREDAYRANNLGVALLEQFDYGGASAAFRDALRLNPALALARVNLSIALLYAIDLENAKREAEEAARLLPRDPHPHYVLGLIARAEGLTDAARAAFERVRDIDPRDVGVQINLGQIDLQQQRYTEAMAAFRAALAEEPYNVTAAYNLGLALTRAGHRDEGRKAMEQSQALRAGGYGTVFSTNYLEQGRYAEAMASTGAEPELVDRTVPNVTFTHSPIDSKSRTASGALMPSPFGKRFTASDLADGGRTIADAVAGGITLLDFDRDSDLDLFTIGAGSVQLLRNDRGTWVDVTGESGLARALSSGGTACVAADYDNDGDADLLVIRHGGSVLLHNDGGRFSDVTVPSGLPPYPFLSVSAAFVDLDHDGDLDLVIAGLADLTTAHERARAGALTFPDDFPGAPAQVIQNNGNGTFTDISSKANVGGLRHAVAVVPTDYDNRRDLDVLIATYDGAPALFTNLRDGTFRDDASRAGLQVEGRVTSVTTADFNRDEFPDFLFGRAAAPGVFAVSSGRGRFTMVQAPEATAGAAAAQFLDYDNDGLLDLLVWTSDGPRVLRNVGGDWTDTTGRTFPPAGPGIPTAGLLSARALAAADIDHDGDVDFVADEDRRGPALWRNDGGNRNQSLRVRLSGRVSNRAGIGAKIELRAGSLRQRLETIVSTPAAGPADVLFGLGSRPGADVVRVLWPSGILQAETTSPTVPALTSPLAVEELNRKPSSCPFLYTWNGRGFEFVTDFLGGGEMGYWQAPGVRNRPDPVEYVRIRESQLQPKDGRYEIRVTNELEEAVFVDRLALACDHTRARRGGLPERGYDRSPQEVPAVPGASGFSAAARDRRSRPRRDAAHCRT